MTTAHMGYKAGHCAQNVLGTSIIGISPWDHDLLPTMTMTAAASGEGVGVVKSLHPE